MYSDNLQFVHIVTIRHADANVRITDSDLASVQEVVMSLDGLRHAKFHTASAARDKYTDDGHSPVLVIESYFDDLAKLEATIAEQGRMQDLARLVTVLTSLAGVEVEHQVMISRPFPVLEPVPENTGTQCSYLVHYPGFAEDFYAWINYYLAHHPQIMKFFPAIRGVEIYTRIDWLDAMPWKRVNFMQRNKQVFDDPAALEAALNSPVRDDMRRDFENFPKFFDSNRHFAMITRSLRKE